MKRQLTKRLSLPGVSVKSQKQLENTLILEGERRLVNCRFMLVIFDYYLNILA